MKVASIAEAKNHLGALLERVKRGHTVLITERGRPVARLAPIESADDPEARLERLDRRGLIRRGRPTRETRDLILSPPPKPRKPVDVVKMLIEERQGGW